MRLPHSTVQQRERRQNLYFFSMLEEKRTRERVCMMIAIVMNRRWKEREERKEQSGTEINCI